MYVNIDYVQIHTSNYTYILKRNNSKVSSIFENVPK